MGLIYSKQMLGAAAALAFFTAAVPAKAQTRAETLRYVTGAAVNTLDPNIPGSTREAFASASRPMTVWCRSAASS
jgi:peptide/nickel transport system substrate-binding protein